MDRRLFFKTIAVIAAGSHFGESAKSEPLPFEEITKLPGGWIRFEQVRVVDVEGMISIATSGAFRAIASRPIEQTRNGILSPDLTPTILVFNFPDGNKLAYQQQNANRKSVIGVPAIVCQRDPNTEWAASEIVRPYDLPIPSGFMRQRVSYQVSRDGMECEFTIIDKELRGHRVSCVR
jgi:hypothetical protein